MTTRLMSNDFIRSLSLSIQESRYKQLTAAFVSGAQACEISFDQSAATGGRSGEQLLDEAMLPDSVAEYVGARILSADRRHAAPTMQLRAHHRALVQDVLDGAAAAIAYEFFESVADNGVTPIYTSAQVPTIAPATRVRSGPGNTSLMRAYADGIALAAMTPLVSDLRQEFVGHRDTLIAQYWTPELLDHAETCTRCTLVLIDLVADHSVIEDGIEAIIVHPQDLDVTDLCVHAPNADRRNHVERTLRSLDGSQLGGSSA